LVNEKTGEAPALKGEKSSEEGDEENVKLLPGETSWNVGEVKGVCIEPRAFA
jgi:hypothetical protein